MHPSNARRVLALAALLLLGSAALAQACTLCATVDLTYAEQLESADVAVIARVVRGGGRTTSCFDILQVLKGKGHLKKNADSIQALCPSSAVAGDLFLVTGEGNAQIQWQWPLPASRRLASYLEQIERAPRDKVPRDKVQRLEFFFRHLDDKDPAVSADALDELARVPVADLGQLKRLTSRARILAQLGDRQLPSSQRRLLLHLLGICGTAQDIPLLEGLLRSEERADKRSLDAAISSYLALRSTAGLAVIDELFIANRDADYADTYNAILALRFHLAAGTLPRQQLVLTMRGMLQRPELSDLVMNDLARAKDWESLEQVMRLFRTAGPETNWLRLPAVNFLRACPLPQAKEYLRECADIDPAAVERAQQFSF